MSGVADGDRGAPLAKQMYGSRDFSLMPSLADALQDAGCEDASILGHCRVAGLALGRV